MTYCDIFGMNLRRIRRASRMTQRDLAWDIGLTEKQISDIETGRSFVSMKTLEKLCRVLSIPPDVLFRLEQHHQQSRVEQA